MFQTRITVLLTTENVPAVDPLLAKLATQGLAVDYVQVSRHVPSSSSAVGGEAITGANTAHFNVGQAASQAGAGQVGAIADQAAGTEPKKTTRNKAKADSEPAAPTRGELEVQVRAILTPLAQDGHGDEVSDLVKSLGFATVKAVPDAASMQTLLDAAKEFEAKIKGGSGSALD